MPTLAIQNPGLRVTKSISFRYKSSNEIASLFEDFRLMCNDAIRIAEESKPRSRFDLIALAYPRLKSYGLHTLYILSACEVAHSVYRNKKRKRIPHIRRAFLKLGSQGYQLNHLLLRIPITPKHFLFLTLQGSDYHSAYIDNPDLKRGSVTITPSVVLITFSRRVPTTEPRGYIGIDLNERNVTVSSTDGYCHAFEELGDVTEIKERYRESRAHIEKIVHNDRRIGKALLAKYGKRERNRTVQRINLITKRIVDYAKGQKFGIKMERLTGIRRKYRKGNGRGTSIRARMNTWVYGEVQRQVAYKATWEGIPQWYVDPRDTSRICPDCGSRVAKLAGRKLHCLKCDKIWDRDVLASRNVMACVVPQARPSKGSSEGERGDDCSTPQSRWREVALDDSKEPRAN